MTMIAELKSDSSLDQVGGFLVRGPSGARGEELLAGSRFWLEDSSGRVRATLAKSYFGADLHDGHVIRGHLRMTEENGEEIAELRSAVVIRSAALPVSLLRAEGDAEQRFLARLAVIINDVDHYGLRLFADTVFNDERGGNENIYLAFRGVKPCQGWRGD